MSPGRITRIDWNHGDPVIVLEKSWLRFGNLGLTLGHVVALKQPRAVDKDTYQHELAHVKQHNVLGPAYLPLHILAQTWSGITSGSYRENNPLEYGPREKPSRPWW
jgi:hypothetical protein